MEGLAICVGALAGRCARRVSGSILTVFGTAPVGATVCHVGRVAGAIR